MSVLRQDYVAEIFAGLAKRGVDVQHIVLHADRRVLRERIEQDTEHSGDTRAWRLSKIDAYLRAFDQCIRTARHVIGTAGVPVAEVVVQVAALMPSGRESS